MSNRLSGGSNVAILLNNGLKFSVNIFKTHFDRIKKMIDSGLMVHWRAKFWPPEDACSLKTDGDITVKPVNVMDMTGIFFILGCGKTNNIYNSIKYRKIH